MNTVVSPLSHQCDIRIKSEPIDDGVYNDCPQEGDSCDNLVSVKLELADTASDPYFAVYDSVSDINSATQQRSYLGSGFDYAWVTEAPELRKLLSEPAATNGGSSANSADVQWLNEYVSKPKLTPWEEQIRTSLNAENDRGLTQSETNAQNRQILADEKMSHVRTNERLWRQMISPRKRTYEEMVSEAIGQAYSPLCGKNTADAQHSDSGKENYEEPEERIYPASAALKKLCTSEMTIRSILSSPQATLKPTTPAVPGTEQLASSVIRSLLTCELKPTTTTAATRTSPRQRNSSCAQPTPNGVNGIGDVMRRLQTTTTLLASSSTKREATTRKPPAAKSSSPSAKLVGPNCASEQSTIRSLLTAPLPPPKPLKTDKPVLLTLLTEAPQEVSRPITPPRALLLSPPVFSLTTSYAMSANLRRLLNRPLSTLLELDSSSAKFADVAHAFGLAQATNDGMYYRLPDEFLDGNGGFDFGVYDSGSSQPGPSLVAADFGDIFPCPDCHRTFATDEELLDHSTSHDERTFMCAECGDEFTKKRALVKHVKRDHKLVVTLGKSKPNVDSNGKTALSENGSDRTGDHSWDNNSSRCDDFEKRDRISGTSMPTLAGYHGNHRANQSSTSRSVVVVKEEVEDGLWHLTDDGGETFLVEKNEEYDSDS